MAKKYYKVVRRSRGCLLSAIAGWYQWATDYEVAYTTDAWTRGIRKTPVLAFSSLKPAQHFASEAHEIWEAEVKHPRKLRTIAFAAGPSKYLALFWRDIEGQRWDRSVSAEPRGVEAPPDTVACEAIKLVKKVT